MPARVDRLGRRHDVAGLGGAHHVQQGKGLVLHLLGDDALQSVLLGAEVDEPLEQGGLDQVAAETQFHSYSSHAILLRCARREACPRAAVQPGSRARPASAGLWLGTRPGR
ncbi:hypothetical protein [Streptomyces wuyuanensis]|uniref:hypothetical protein n=1 Tax=Streptomyces wuyuanensis TaxID=1196353 RepID=UPI003D7620AF